MRRFIVFLLALYTLALTAQPVLDLGLQRRLQTPVAQAALAPSTYAGFPMVDTLSVLVVTRPGAPCPAGCVQPVAPNVYRARVDLQQLRQWAADTTLVRLAISTTHRLLTDRTREATATERVQSASTLLTPYTGRGVIIAVFDEGFEYRHATFNDTDGQSRVRYVWNRRIADTQPTTDIPTGGDGYDNTGGHATHVASIAAGASVSGSEYYGMAPEAELIFIPSNLDNAELLEDAAFVADVAAREGKRWIINASFGSHDGPHDGRDLYSQTMNRILLENGGFMVAAMGNEGGQKLHAQAELRSETDEPLRFLITPTGSTAMLDLWLQADDSLRHAEMRPFVLRNGEVEYQSVDLTSAFAEEINPDNHKQHASLVISRSLLYTSGGYLPVGIEVRPRTTAHAAEQPIAIATAHLHDASGIAVHAWTDEGMGEFYSPDARFVEGDAQYMVCEGGATVPSAVAVAAYAAANTTERLNGAALSFTTAFPLGQICSFSNLGPYLGQATKPTISAPGAVIRAAVSKHAPDFSARASSLVERRTWNGEYYYYGYKSGTSMATPVVAGIIALWLEAFPQMTRDQLETILAASAHPQADANAWGYGTIDAFAGLQMALEMAEQTGCETLRVNALPVALQLRGNAWNVLACTPIAQLRWRITDAAGRTLRSGATNTLSPGSEQQIALHNLPHGIYILQLCADGHTVAQKFRW